MTDPVNLDVARAFSLMSGPFSIVDNQWALTSGSRDGALRVRGQLFVVTQSVNQAAVTLPGLWNNEAAPIIVVVNNSPNTIRVGCSGPSGPNPSIDTMNLTATLQNFSAGFANVTTKSSLVCIASQSPFGKGGGPTLSPNNWHTGLFS